MPRLIYDNTFAIISTTLQLESEESYDVKEKIKLLCQPSSLIAKGENKFFPSRLRSVSSSATLLI